MCCLSTRLWGRGGCSVMTASVGARDTLYPLLCDRNFTSSPLCPRLASKLRGNLPDVVCTAAAAVAAGSVAVRGRESGSTACEALLRVRYGAVVTARMTASAYTPRRRLK